MEIKDIDFVVTWVDGNDPRLNSLRLKYWQEQPPTHRPAQPTPPATQYANSNEIIYCLASILRHASFVRRIHVITDQQQPPLWLLSAFGFNSDELGKISIVDHKEIFKGLDDLTPCFNSLSIESVIHRTPGLADHFVYMNDDFFIIKPTTAADYFAAPETPIVNGKIRPYISIYLRLKLWLINAQSKRRTPRWSFINGCMIAAQKTGMRLRYILLDHSPRPIYKPLLDQFLEARPDLLRENASHRFRNYHQFLPQALASCLSLRENKLKVNSNQHISRFLRPNKNPEDNFTTKNWKRRLFWPKILQQNKENNSKDPLFLCIQNLDQATEAERDSMLAYMNQMFTLQRSKAP